MTSRFFGRFFTSPRHMASQKSDPPQT